MRREPIKKVRLARPPGQSSSRLGVMVNCRPTLPGNSPAGRTRPEVFAIGVRAYCSTTSRWQSTHASAAAKRSIRSPSEEHLQTELDVAWRVGDAGDPAEVPRRQIAHRRAEYHAVKRIRHLRAEL